MSRAGSFLFGTYRQLSRCWKRAVLISAAILAMTHSGAAQQAPGEPVVIPGADIPGWGHVDTVRGSFGRPPGKTGKFPAVLILHSSGGVDGTGAFYATALQAAGIAALEISMFGGGSRPAAGHQADYPAEAAALRWLAAQPQVDGQRLGVMGFSWGGVDTLMMASEMVQERMGKDVPKPAAFAPFYPSCINMSQSVRKPDSAFYNAQTSMRAVPMLIQEGTKDDYEVGDHPCEVFIAMCRRRRVTKSPCVITKATRTDSMNGEDRGKAGISVIHSHMAHRVAKFVSSPTTKLRWKHSRQWSTSSSSI